MPSPTTTSTGSSTGVCSSVPRRVHAWSSRDSPAGWSRGAGLDAVRAWVDCDESVRAARVAQREGITEAQALAENRVRAKLEQQRYLDIHGIDMSDLSIYDLLLDSGQLGPEPIAEAIVGAARVRFG